MTITAEQVAGRVDCSDGRCEAWQRYKDQPQHDPKFREWQTSSLAADVMMIRRVLETAGAQFIDGDAPSVTLRKEK